MDGQITSFPIPAISIAGGATAANQLAEIALLTTIDANAGYLPSIDATLAVLATEATLDLVRLAVESIDTKIPALGQATMAASLPVAIASDQTALTVSVSSSALPTGAATEATLSTLNGKVTACNTGAVVVSSSALPTGAATQATLSTVSSTLTQANVYQASMDSYLYAIDYNIQNIIATVAGQTTGNNSLSSIDTKTPALGQATMANSSPVVIASNQTAVPVSASSLPLPTGAATSANQTTANSSLSSIDGKLNSLGQKAMTASMPVVIASDQGAIPISGSITASPGTSSTSSVTSVASSASNVTMLSSNASRKNATFYNDSTQIAYLKLGATASSTSYTVQLQAGQYYELPTGQIYTGQIDAIWASANGNMRITELT
jgi:hypothetical protein